MCKSFFFRYCVTNAPNVETEGNIKIQFISDASAIREGAQCTIACIEDSPPPATTTTTTSTTEPECMLGYDSICLSCTSTESRTAYCPFKVDFAIE